MGREGRTDLLLEDRSGRGARLRPNRGGLHACNSMGGRATWDEGQWHHAQKRMRATAIPRSFASLCLPSSSTATRTSPPCLSASCARSRTGSRYAGAKKALKPALPGRAESASGWGCCSDAGGGDGAEGGFTLDVLTCKTTRSVASSSYAGLRKRKNTRVLRMRRDEAVELAEDVDAWDDRISEMTSSTCSRDAARIRSACAQKTGGVRPFDQASWLFRTGSEVESAQDSSFRSGTRSEERTRRHFPARK